MYKTNLFIVLTILLALFFSSDLFSQEIIRWVAVDGNDNNEGTEEDPYATINRALQDKKEFPDNPLIINIKAGNYDQVVVINTGGTSTENKITITAENFLDKPKFRGNTGLFSSKDAVIRWNAEHNYVTIDGIVVENATANNNMRGIWVDGDYNTIRRCEVRNIKRTGIVVYGDNNTVEDNIVENITGGLAPDEAGNNISVETYYKAGDPVIRRTSDNNTIQRNTLSNNATHFGVNIFPNTLDPLQPEMHNNKVYSNYVIDCGGGIYSRYQVNMEIMNNFLVESSAGPSWQTTEAGITFDYSDRFPDSHPHPFDGGTIKIYNNTICANDVYGIYNIDCNTLEIYNNIFVDNNNFHITFEFSSIHIDADTKIDNNLYYGTGCWKWGQNGSTCTFTTWKTLSQRDQLSINNLNPQFTTFDGKSYAIDYFSPAKNNGKVLSGVELDKFDRPRPYWNSDFDIGAYEVEDTQLKFTTTLGEGVIQNLTSYGTYWERNSIGVYNVSTYQGLNSASCATYNDPLDEHELWKFPGVEYKWMDWSNNSSGYRIAAGIYKISNNNNSNSYFYLDLRDAVENYNLNLYLQLVGGDPPFYRFYRNGTFLNHDIANNSIKRIWEIDVNGEGEPNTLALNNYWHNALVQVNGVGQNPRLIWGPNNPNYTVQRNFEGTWDALTPTPILGMAYLDETIIIYPPGVPHQDVYYRIKNSLNNYSNEVLVLRSKMEKKGNQISNYESVLNQNYPNPFNPSTTISFSLANNGIVKLKIYDITGREIKILVDGEYESGEYNVQFNAYNLSSGVYFYQLTCGDFRQTRKLHVLK